MESWWMQREATMTCTTAFSYAMVAQEIGCYEDVQTCLQFIFLESDNNEDFFTETRWEELVVLAIAAYQVLLLFFPFPV